MTQVDPVAQLAGIVVVVLVVVEVVDVVVVVVNTRLRLHVPAEIANSQTLFHFSYKSAAAAAV